MLGKFRQEFSCLFPKPVLPYFSFIEDSQIDFVTRNVIWTFGGRGVLSWTFLLSQINIDFLSTQNFQWSWLVFPHFPLCKNCFQIIPPPLTSSTVLTQKALGFLLPLQHWGVFSTPSVSLDPDILKSWNLQGWYSFYALHNVQIWKLNNNKWRHYQKQWENLISYTSLHKIWSK